MRWIVGVSIFAVAMGWVAMATIPAATITPDESVLKYLPAETEGVAFIDVAALRTAPLVQDALKNKPLTLDVPRGLKDFSAATGFVPERDIDKITIGKIGTREPLAIVQARQIGRS